MGRGAHDWAVSHGIPPCPSEKMASSESCCTDYIFHLRNECSLAAKLNQNTVLKTTLGRGAFIYVDVIFSHTEFSLSAYKRNKRKMELAEKIDTGHNHTKKRRQSSENVSTVS